MKRKLIASSLLSLLLALVLLVGQFAGLAPQTFSGPGMAAAQAEQLIAKSKKKNTPTPKPSKTPKPTKTPAPTASPTPAPTAVPDAAVTPSPVPDGPIIDPQSIADYIFANGCLPDNFITKKQAQKLGWDSTRNYVSDVAPGKSIGGDYFGNYEGLVPTAKGREYHECDCYYISGKRSAYRIIYSNDGLVFYTEDHYQTFIPMYPSHIQTLPPSPTPVRWR